MELKVKLRQLLGSKHGTAVITALGVSGLLLIMVSDLMPVGNKEKPPVRDSAEAYADSYCADTEKRLAGFLGHIDGAGDVKVYLSVGGGEKYIYASEGRRSRSENRTEEENKYVIVSGEGGRNALIEQVRTPEITGAAVLCSGGDVPAVRERIYHAVSAALEIPTSKIYVTKLE